ncbi:hypothetical protein D3C80_1385990 [compost metagenome]
MESKTPRSCSKLHNIHWLRAISPIHSILKKPKDHFCICRSDHRITRYILGNLVIIPGLRSLLFIIFSLDFPDRRFTETVTLFRVACHLGLPEKYFVFVIFGLAFINDIRFINFSVDRIFNDLVMVTLGVGIMKLIMIIYFLCCIRLYAVLVLQAYYMVSLYPTSYDSRFTDIFPTLHVNQN